MLSDGRRLLAIASIAMIAVALLHTVANLVTGPEDADLAAVEQAMRGYHLELGLMTPSVSDVFRALVFTMSVCLAGMGLLGIVLTRDASVPPHVLHRAAVLLALASGLLTAITRSIRSRARW
jgi:hypothetical protein